MSQVNWKPAFFMSGQEKPSTNAQVFATESEALSSAAARFAVWTMPTNFTAVPTGDAVNYKIEDGREVRL